MITQKTYKHLAEWTWTERATHAVLCNLPAGTRTAEGRRRSKLVTWLVSRKLDRAPVEERSPELEISAGVHRFVTTLNEIGARPGMHYEACKPGRVWQRVCRVETNRFTGERMGRSASYFVNLQTGTVHEAECWKRPRRWICMQDVRKIQHGRISIRPSHL